MSKFQPKIMPLPRVAVIHKEISMGLGKCPYPTGVPAPSEKKKLSLSLGV